jgi:hypothetical protein
LSGGNGIGNGDEIRAFAGTQDADSEWIAHMI